MCLDETRPVYGIQPRGLDGVLVPHSTIHAAVECYLGELERIYHRGPIHLLGHSFGGWVAFQMAQRFLQAKRPVETLIILDSNAPDDQHTPAREYGDVDIMMEWVDTLEQIVERSLNVRRSDFDVRDETAQIKFLHRLMVRESIMPNRSVPDALRGPLRTFSASLRTQYKPDTPYPGPVKLVLADNVKLDASANRRMHQEIEEGWRQWAPDLTCLHTSGNHMTMLKQPHVRDLAQRMGLT
jgi:syringomycin synthetase protein SyrE